MQKKPAGERMSRQNMKRVVIDVSARKKKIYAHDFGILPQGNGEIFYAGEQINRLISSYPKDTEIIFDRGDYYIRPVCSLDYRLSNTDALPLRAIGILLKETENVTLDFSGSNLFFEGQMQPFTLDHTASTTVRNVSLDWKRPLSAEGIVVGYQTVGDRPYIDLYVDPSLFPHRFADGELTFDTGNGEWYPLRKGSHIQYDRESMTVLRNSGDGFCPERIEELGNDIYRMYAANCRTALDNVFVLRIGERLHAAVFSEKCTDTLIENVRIFSCGGLGCLAQFCHNITFSHVDFEPNRSAGRRISNGHDDGMHVTCCSGTVTVRDCTFVGLMDDPINVHSCCVTAERVENATTLICRYRHSEAKNFLYYAEKGDRMAFIDRNNMGKIGEGNVLTYRLLSEERFELTFDSPIEPELRSRIEENEETVALDNLTHTAAFVCVNNRFGSCRARGILVSTPEPVRIEGNYFASSGAAILVAGDSNYWFESGECHDVLIRNNVFTDVCLSSEYQFGYGMISICPVVPSPDLDVPYHKNIRIKDNVFDTGDIPVLYAYATKGISFTGNRIFRSPAYTEKGGSLLRFSWCSEIEEENNSLIGSFGKELILKENCR